MAKKTFRNVIAKDLRTPKYRSQVVVDKKKRQQRLKCRRYVHEYSARH